MKTLRMSLIGIGMALLSIAAHAESSIQLSNPGSASYEPGTGSLVIQSAPFVARLDSLGGRQLIAQVRDFTAAAQLDPGTGAFVSGVNGDDVALVGNITGTPYAGVLLTGEFESLIIRDDASSTDALEARVRITGGTLATEPGFAAGYARLYLSLESVTSGGVVAPAIPWGSPWVSSAAKGDLTGTQ